ncbi:MAG: tetratricopeptide repeat protein, partial [Acidobacteria bacterium]|nr:tetratricopeptide repeat protein [Acidobacteriota bacterium]
FKLRGEYADALIYYQMALKIAREVNDRELESGSLNNIGVVYEQSGRFTEAIAQYTESLKIVRELKNKRAEGETLQNIGAAYAASGEYAKALEQYEASLKIARELTNIESWVSLLQNMGALFTLVGQYDEALRMFDGALPIVKANNNKIKEVTVLNNMGLLYLLMAREEDALRVSQSALTIAQSIASTNGELHSYEVLGVTYERKKRWEEAVDAYRQAIRRIERLRTEVREQSLQTSLFENLTLPYQSLARSLLELNQGSEAFAVSEQAKARTLVDLIQNGKVDILKAMTDVERRQEQELDSRIMALVRQVNVAHSGRAADLDIEESKNQLAAARSAYDEFRRQLFLRHPELQTQRAQFEPVKLVQLNQTLFAEEPKL